MSFLLLSVLCSVLVSVLLKLAQRRGVAMPPLLFWNYVAAVALCGWLLAPPLAALRDAHTPWLELALLALLLPTIFLAMAASVKSAGIARTDVAQRLSLVLSLLAAFLWFGESADAVKLAGLSVGLAAIPLILARPREGDAGTRTNAWALPLIVLVGYASVDVLLKQIARSGTPFAASLFVAFVGALIIMMLLQGWRGLQRRAQFSRGALMAGLLVGASNFANILFYVKAHRALPDHPAVVFATMNLGVVVLGTLVGYFGFRERLRAYNWLGIALAVLAVGVIAASMALA